MTDRRIILAHGLNGEMGVPTSIRPSGLPWPRLDADLLFFKNKTATAPLILGRKTYEIVSRFSAFDKDKLLQVSQELAGEHNTFASLEDALAAAEEWYPYSPVYIGGGEQLAKHAFALLENDGRGMFYETVVEDTFPQADVVMPEFREELWTEPEVFARYERSVTAAPTYSGTYAYGPLPAFRMQVRTVK